MSDWMHGFIAGYISAAVIMFLIAQMTVDAIIKRRLDQLKKTPAPSRKGKL